MATVTQTQSWNSIQKLYPDYFVLLENPVFKPNSSFLDSGIFRYKHKNRKKVFEKDLELNLKHTTVRYTGGKRLDAIDENLLIL